MEKKYIFFDIDGTLTDANPGGNVLPSTLKTLTKLKENGHFVAIASGRAQWMTVDFAKEVGIENIVSDGGNGLTINNELKYIYPLDFQIANTLIDECIRYDLGYGVSLGNDNLLYSNRDKIKDYPIYLKTIVDHQLDFKKVKNIYKIFIYANKEQQKMLSLNQIDHMAYIEGQVIVEPANKYRGILEMVQIMGGDAKDIVVFGDSYNDYSMMKQAPISIAMGNALPEIKEIATFVTKRNDDDGIEYACLHYGWI